MQGLRQEVDMSGWRFSKETMKCDSDCCLCGGGGGRLVVGCFGFGSSSVLPISPARTRPPWACSILPLPVLCKIPYFLVSHLIIHLPITLLAITVIQESSLEVFCIPIFLEDTLGMHLPVEKLGESRNRAGVLAMGNPKQ